MLRNKGITCFCLDMKMNMGCAILYEERTFTSTTFLLSHPFCRNGPCHSLYHIGPQNWHRLCYCPRSIVVTTPVVWLFMHSLAPSSNCLQVFPTRSSVGIGWSIASVFTCFSPVITLQIFLNRLPCSGFFVKNCHSFSRKHLIPICRDLLGAADMWPFSSSLIALALSRSKISPILDVPPASRKFLSQMAFGRELLALKNLASAELFGLSFCLADCLLRMPPHPKDIVPPRRLTMSGCTAYDASTHVQNLPKKTSATTMVY